MGQYAFPPLELSDDNGLLAFGADLEVPTLIHAYSRGIFPWPLGPDYPLAWFSPDPRGVLYIDELHISRSMRKFMHKDLYHVTFNQQFEAVIKHCAETPRKDRPTTWITDELAKAYINLFHAKNAYSVEVWRKKDSQLVAGLYGVFLNHYVTGESMFHIEDNTSKLALIYLVLHLKSHGIDWIDTQMVTPVIKSLGGREIPRKLFVKMLQTSLKKNSDSLF